MIDLADKTGAMQPPQSEHSPPDSTSQPTGSLRATLNEIIFGVDTPAGKAFDIFLLICIIISVVAVMIDSVDEIHANYATELYALEWVLTIFFTIEYIIRLYCVRNRWRYALSFYGIVDLLSIIPTYLSLFVGGYHSLLVIRALRLLRIFRVLKLVHYMQDANIVLSALQNSSRKILTFLMTVVVIALIVGTMMYLIEGRHDDTGFTSIPRSMYWAIVTVTTVGYGDISPQTNLGQFLAGLLMITGYAIIAVPTGIVSVEMAQATERARLAADHVCSNCGSRGHSPVAKFCNMCGQPMAAPRP